MIFWIGINGITKVRIILFLIAHKCYLKWLLLAPKFWKVGALLIILCHSINVGSVVGIQKMVGSFKHYFMQNNLFELFALTGSRTKKFRCKCLCPSHLVEFPLPNFFTDWLVSFRFSMVCWLWYASIGPLIKEIDSVTTEKYICFQNEDTFI